jgi:putative FmdB family regulatory protein
VPTYQYACTECGHAFEQFQSFSDDALTVCPECQGRLRKVFNAVGVVFKGSGFYRTDSRSSSSSSDASSTPAGAAKSSSDAGSPSAGSSSAAGSSAGSGSSSNGSSTSSKPAAAGAAS